MVCAHSAAETAYIVCRKETTGAFNIWSRDQTILMVGLTCFVVQANIAEFERGLGLTNKLENRLKELVSDVKVQQGELAVLNMVVEKVQMTLISKKCLALGLHSTNRAMAEHFASRNLLLDSFLLFFSSCLLLCVHQKLFAFVLSFIIFCAPTTEESIFSLLSNCPRRQNPITIQRTYLRRLLL